MMALMQLLPFFEKHMSGIKLLSISDPIIRFAKTTLFIQVKSASRSHIARHLWT